MTQLVECLPILHDFPGSSPQHYTNQVWCYTLARGGGGMERQAAQMFKVIPSYTASLMPFGAT